MAFQTKFYCVAVVVNPTFHGEIQIYKQSALECVAKAVKPSSRLRLLLYCLHSKFLDLASEMVFIFSYLIFTVKKNNLRKLLTFSWLISTNS